MSCNINLGIKILLFRAGSAILTFGPEVGLNSARYNGDKFLQKISVVKIDRASAMKV